MDAHLSVGQPAAIYESARAFRHNVYTDIPGNHPYHYSWHQNSLIVVGTGGGQHRNFTCAISNRFVVTLPQLGGALPVGAGGINVAALLTNVTAMLHTRFRLLIQTAAFNNLGRSHHHLTFHNNELVNRHETRKLRIGNTTIDPGRSHTFAAGTMNGFTVFRHLPGLDTYYRNYDFNETTDAAVDERLRIQYNPVVLNGTLAPANYNIQLL
ncbi:hypothetical protein [Nocardia acidivorans]|uniref:hypothetical protein n=1 Tax=Nocardia acidivorans TaxID=404580 RepID=UPI0008303DCB|nr:hypothetical protein [Nocardia acidivorans]